MLNTLTVQDLDVILESFNYSKLKIENHQYNADEYRLKQEKLKELEEVVAKIRLMKKELKGAK